MIRPASIEDAGEIASLHGKCLPDQPWSRSAVASLLADPAGFGYLAEGSGAVDAEPLGYSLARTASDECGLLALGVLSAARGQGRGRRLLEAVKTRARKRCCARVFLEVAESNDVALNLYLNGGFAVIGRRKGYYRPSKGVVSDALVLGTVDLLG